MKDAGSHVSHHVRKQVDGVADTVTLDYAARFVRRKRLRTDTGADLLIDLAETVSLDHGDALATETGVLIGVRAAEEELLEIRAEPANLARIAWHVGNRHCPAQIEAGRILIQADAVMARLLAHLGARVAKVVAPFSPEGGAYGAGRTHGHHHAHDHANAHDHATDPADGRPDA